VVGEMWDEDPALVSFFQGGRKQFDGVDSGVDALFDFPLYGAIRRVFAHDAPAEDLVKVLAHDRLYPDPNFLVTFLGSHDTPRFMSESGVGFEDLKMAFTLLMTTRGIPMIYYGDEIAMRGGGDPDNRRDFPGGWREDSRNAFEEQGRTPQQQAIFDYVRLLTRVRAKLEPLRKGTTVDLLANDRVYAFARVLGKTAELVVLNTDTKRATVSVDASRLPVAPLMRTSVWLCGSWHDELGMAPDAQCQDYRITVTTPPRSAAIYSIAQ